MKFKNKGAIVQRFFRGTGLPFFIVAGVLFTGLFFVALFALASFREQISFSQALHSFSQQFYSGNKNEFTAGKFLGHNILYYFYVLCGLLGAGAILMRFWGRGRGQATDWREMVIVAGVITFVVYGFFQEVHRWQIFAKEFRDFNEKIIEERISHYFKDSYAYAQYCQKHLPGKHVGKAITETDIGEARAMFTFFGVAYYLYPIDIRVQQSRTPDCLIIFLKNDPLQAVPEGYRVMESYDDKSLIAIREDLLDDRHH